MSSGVVEYKLCDKGFDCDNCAFDKALWQKSKAAMAASESKGVISKLQKSIVEDENRNECLFIRDYLVLRRLYKNSYFIGFSKFFRVCLDPPKELHVETKKGFITKNSSVYHLTRGNLSWDISLPFDCHLLSSMSEQFHTAQNSEWLGLIEADEQEVETAAITAQGFRQCASAALKELSLEISPGEVGLTMFDGGLMVETLAELLGPEKYKKFILQLCGRNN
jgi:hypothetical protein